MASGQKQSRKQKSANRCDPSDGLCFLWRSAAAQLFREPDSALLTPVGPAALLRRALPRGGGGLFSVWPASTVHHASPRFLSDEFPHRAVGLTGDLRSEEHTSELQSLMRISYAVFCLKKKNTRDQ